MPLFGVKNRRKGAARWRCGVGACPAPPGVWGLTCAHLQGTPKSCSWEGGWGSQGPCVHPCLSLSQGTQGSSADSSFGSPTAGAGGLQDPPHRSDVPLSMCPAGLSPPGLSPQSPPGWGGRAHMHGHSARAVSSQDRGTQRWLQVQLETWKILWMVGQW